MPKIRGPHYFSRVQLVRGQAPAQARDMSRINLPHDSQPAILTDRRWVDEHYRISKRTCRSMRAQTPGPKRAGGATSKVRSPFSRTTSGNMTNTDGPGTPNAAALPAGATSPVAGRNDVPGGRGRRLHGAGREVGGTARPPRLLGQPHVQTPSPPYNILRNNF